MSLSFAPATTPTFSGHLPSPLTSREVEVISLFLEGLKDDEIGARLGFGAPGVERLISSACEKAGVSDRLGLIIHAIYHGYVPPPL